MAASGSTQVNTYILSCCHDHSEDNGDNQSCGEKYGNFLSIDFSYKLIHSSPLTSCL